MDIISGKSHAELLEFLPQIKSAADEWQLVEVRLAEGMDMELSIHAISERIQTMYQSKEGRIYLCNSREAIMLIRYGKNTNPALLARQITSNLPKDSCKVSVHEPTADRMAKLEIFVDIDKSSKVSPFVQKRRMRKENVILVADDDIYMRMLVRKGLGPEFKVIESADGSDVVENYKKYSPDIVFLDIHMPGKDGLDNLRDIHAIDSEAYIVMLSADSSAENVQFARKHGVKGFLAKPFTKEKLMEHISKCPTIS